MSAATCDVCGAKGETTVGKVHGREVGFPPAGWYRIAIVVPCAKCGEFEVEQKYGCSFGCYQRLASDLVRSTLPPELQDRIARLEEEVRKEAAARRVIN